MKHLFTMKAPLTMLKIFTPFFTRNNLALASTKHMVAKTKSNCSGCFLFHTKQINGTTLLLSDVTSSFLGHKKDKKELCQNSLKLRKLKNLLQNSKKTNAKNSINKVKEFHSINFVKSSSSHSPDRDTNSFLSLILDFSKELPVNLLFSMDQFLFEFSKKTYQQKKTGDFSQQLRERKKFSFFYGHLTKKQLVNLFNKLKKNKGYFYKNLFSLLERRLDVVIYRSGFTKTIAEARQLIKHENILVNQNKISFPSYYLNPGDIVTISPKILKSLNFQLLNGVRTRSETTRPQIFEDFYSRLNKIRPSFFQNLPNFPEKRCEILKQSFKSPEYQKHSVFGNRKLEKLGTSQNFLITQKNFQSRLLCSLLVKLLCTRIKSRCFWKLRKSVSDLFFGFALCSNMLKSYQQLIEENMLILFKRKSFSIDKLTKIKSSSPFLTPKGQHVFKREGGKLFNFVKGFDTDSFLSGVLLARTPVIWNRALRKSKRIKIQNQQKNLKGSLFKKKNLALYRKSFLLFLKYLENYKRFTSLLTLNLKKSLIKRSFYKKKSAYSRILNFRAIKPLHLEVSYNLLNIIYLYSPQRVNFPFSLDLDLIKRSLR